jgi:cytochrome b6-f complex iron-sulfur subunit
MTTPAVPSPLSACASCAVSRRTFLSAATLAGVAAALDACSDVTGPGGGGSVGGGPFTVKLADFPSLASVGGVARVSTSGSPTALVRTGSTTFVAVSMVCTHQGTTVTISNGTYICTNHGARYSATGTWQGGQVTSSLPTFGATYDASAGTVAIARPS